MKIYRYLIVIFLLLSLTACGGSNSASTNTGSRAAVEPDEPVVAVAEPNADASGNCYNEYYPVTNGASWDYTMNSSLSGTDTFTRSIIGMGDGGFTDQDVWTVGTVRTGSWTCDNGNLTALSLGGLATVSASEQTFVATSQESSGITYPSPLNIGTSWSQHLVISGDMVVTEGMSGTATADATQSCTAVGEESVSVSAGTFDALKLNCSTSISVTVDIEGMALDPMMINSTSEVWLVSGVGMVKTVDNNELTNATIELTTYAIP
jgi:hypothetical protein